MKLGLKIGSPVLNAYCVEEYKVKQRIKRPIPQNVMWNTYVYVTQYPNNCQKPNFPGLFRYLGRLMTL